MISLIQKTPVRIYIESSQEDLDAIVKLLTYKDRKVEQAIKNLKKNIRRWGESYVKRRIEELEKELNKTMVFKDEKGLDYIYSGLLNKIQSKFQITYTNEVIYPDFKLIPWKKNPPYEPLPYQEKALDKLLNNSHSHIEAATGVGKSFIALLLAKKTGLPTIITTPSQSIAKQLYDEAKTYFGKDKVGMLGAGKHEVGKHILIAVCKSISIMKDQTQKDELKKYQVLISDESHTLPANQFEYAITNVLGHCPYRWFLSATQERNDGRDLTLEGIIGENVFTYTIQKAIDEGYLAKLSFLVFDITSDKDYTTDNAILMNQEHIYKNEKIASIISSMAYEAVMNDMPTLILIDEKVQEEILRAHMKIEYAFAEGKADNNKICKEFNEGKIMCVIGTSAVSTGTNFKPVRLTINWQANKAGTKVKQGPIGRSTRLDSRTNKKDCKIIDFRVTNVPMLRRHADIRINYYNEVGPVQVLRF